MHERMTPPTSASPATPSKVCGNSSAQLSSLEGFETSSWADLAAGARPPLRNIEDFEPVGHRTGWQHEAAARTEWAFREQDLMLRMGEQARC